MTEVTTGREKIEVVPSCYLGDWLSSGGGCELVTITRRRVSWGQFNESMPSAHPNLPVISHHLQRKTLHLHASGTWVSTSFDLHNLQRNDRAMIRCVCNVTTTKRQVCSQDPLYRMQIDDLKKVPLTREQQFFYCIHILKTVLEKWTHRVWHKAMQFWFLKYRYILWDNVCHFELSSMVSLLPLKLWRGHAQLWQYIYYLFNTSVCLGMSRHREYEVTWSYHDMEMVPVDVPPIRPVTWICEVLFVIDLTKISNESSSCRLFETHQNLCEITLMVELIFVLAGDGIIISVSLPPSTPKVMKLMNGFSWYFQQKLDDTIQGLAESPSQYRDVFIFCGVCVCVCVCVGGGRGVLLATLRRKRIFRQFLC